MNVTIVKEINFNLADAKERKAFVNSIASESGAELTSEILVNGGKVVGSKLLLNGEELATNSVVGIANNLLFEEVVQQVQAARNGKAGLPANTSHAKRGKLSGEDKATMFRLRAEGKSLEEIAQAVNRTVEAVRKVVA